MSCKGSAMPLEASNLPPERRLPTLQRNALRKIFDRHDFSPEEVFSLGYRRLQQAEGIGQKGMETIVSWLKDYGFELSPSVLQVDQGNSVESKGRKRLEHAKQLLQANGYVVRYLGEQNET